MRSLLQLLALCAVVSLCVCYDSHESSESFEDLFWPPKRANSFITPQRTPDRGNSLHHFNSRRKIKSPKERRAEICEDYFPCRSYAYHNGHQQAYRRYFASPNKQQRQAGTPLH